MEKLLIEINLMETSEGSKQQKGETHTHIHTKQKAQTLKPYGKIALEVVK